MLRTDYCGWVVSTATSYLEGPVFKCGIVKHLYSCHFSGVARSAVLYLPDQRIHHWLYYLVCISSVFHNAYVEISDSCVWWTALCCHFNNRGSEICWHLFPSNIIHFSHVLWFPSLHFSWFLFLKLQNLACSVRFLLHLP